MGKRNKLFGAVKRIFSPECLDPQGGANAKKRKWGFGKSKSVDPCSDPKVEACAVPPAVVPQVPTEEVKLTQAEIDQNKQVYSVARATAEAAVAAAHAAAEAVRLTAILERYSGKSEVEVAAIKIQTAFRGYMARRALRALRGLVRVKTLLSSESVKRQSTSALRRSQTLTRLHSEIRSRRIRMTEENQALQRQLQLKRERELEALKAAMGDDWDDSLQSKEQIKASIANKHEAAIRRERALAYAYSHQWKSSSRSVNTMFADPNNLQWGWSWLERWSAAKPLGATNDHTSLKSASHSIGGDIIQSYICRDLKVEKSTPKKSTPTRSGNRQSPSTSQSKPSSPFAGKRRSASPRGECAPSEDSRSIRSLQSERIRRNSITGSSIQDDESLASSPAIPNYMTPTESTKAKSRFHSPSIEKLTTPDRASIGSTKKRLSFPSTDKVAGSPIGGMRRHSVPPKLDSSSIKSISASEQATASGEKR